MPKAPKNAAQQAALKAAIAYYGFSTATNAFPKGTKVSLVTPTPCKRADFEAVAEKVRLAWPENVGAFSRTARLSRDDVRALAKEAGKELSGDAIDDIMVGIAAADPSRVLVVEIQHGEDTKMLLVNVAIHA